jgi:hypothetical protein
LYRLSWQYIDLYRGAAVDSLSVLLQLAVQPIRLLQPLLAALDGDFRCAVLAARTVMSCLDA